MLSQGLIDERVEYTYPQLVAHMKKSDKAALTACAYNVDFVKKTTWNKQIFVNKEPGGERAEYTGLIVGEVVDQGDGTKISALGNYWPGRPEDSTYVCDLFTVTLSL
jgi:hypothetical protein